MSDYFYYCPVCGSVKDVVMDFCVICNSEMGCSVRSKHEQEYYTAKGNPIDCLLNEEIKPNPLFDEKEYEHKHQVHSQTLEMISNRLLEERMQNNPNSPRCPTCKSTNIGKISTTSKVAGAAMFGLFSKTAKSQFKCNNCGYKW